LFKNILYYFPETPSFHQSVRSIWSENRNSVMLPSIQLSLPRKW